MKAKIKIRVFMIICLLGFVSMTSEAKDYRYTIYGGSPNRYPAIYDFNGNYFIDHKGAILLPFVPSGNAMYWGNGTQATLASEHNPMPYGIKVRWFSVAENIFWEGSYTFDQQMLNRLTHYKSMDFTFKHNDYFVNSMSFIVYVTPGGLVSVWINGNGEKFLLAQFYAKQMQHEPNWNDFYRRTIDGRGEPETQEEYVKEYLVRQKKYIQQALNGKAEFFDDTQPAGKLTAAPWLRLMKTYDWYLSINDQYFILRDYRVYYVNAESHFIYSGDDQLKTPRPIPSMINFFFQSKQDNNQIYRIDIDFNQDEIMQYFSELALTPPLDNPIELFVNIKPDLKGIAIYLKKGDKQIKLKKARPRLVDLYNGGYDVDIPWPEQIRHWK